MFSIGLTTFKQESFAANGSGRLFFHGGGIGPIPGTVCPGADSSFAVTPTTNTGLETAIHNRSDRFPITLAMITLHHARRAPQESYPVEF